VFSAAEEEREHRVRVQLLAEVRVVGEGKQIQARSVRLPGKPSRFRRIADINAVPGAQSGAEHHLAIWHQ
jgi:hypothetical protein